MAHGQSMLPAIPLGIGPVSYTHLDVYKRQAFHVQGADVVVVLGDFAVAVKEQDVGGFGIGQMAARSDRHAFGHGNRQVADVVRGIASEAGARIKQIGEYIRPVERRIIGERFGGCLLYTSRCV